MNINKFSINSFQLPLTYTHEAHGLRLIQACTDADSKLALRLLKEPRVKLEAAAQGNQAFLIACQKGLGKLALALLKIPEVRALAAINNNLALHCACEHENDALVLQLLSMSSVLALAANHNNQALFYLLSKSYEKAALKLMHEPQVASILRKNFASALHKACEEGYGKLAMYLLGYQYPLTNDDYLFLQAKKNKLYKVALRLLQNPKIAMSVSNEAYNDFIDDLIFPLKNRRLVLKILQHPRMMANFSYVHFFHICRQKSSKLAMLILTITTVRAKLLPYHDDIILKAIELSLDKVVIKLLSYPEFAAHAAFESNCYLTISCQFGLPNLAQRLLELDVVKENLMANIDLVFEVFEDEIFLPANRAIIILLEEHQKNMLPVLYQILKLRELAGVYDLPGTALHAKVYFKLACLLSSNKLALELWNNTLAKEQISNYESFFWACYGGLSNLAIKMLEVPSISSQAANYDNAALMMACCLNQKRLALRLLELPAVQANVGAYHHLSLQGACSLDLKDDSLIYKLLLYSNISQCMDNNHFKCSIIGSALPYKGFYNNQILLQNQNQDPDQLYLNSNHVSEIYNQLKDRIDSRNCNKAQYNFKLVLAFQLNSKLWIELKTNNNWETSLQQEKLILKAQQNLSSDDKIDLMTTLRKTQRALNYYFPLTCLPKQSNSIPNELVHKIFAYDEHNSFMHLRYAIEQFNKNPNLRTKLATS